MLGEFGHEWGYTENPPENAIFQSAGLRVSAVVSACTDRGSFRYTDVKDDLPYLAGFSLACFARIALARSSIIVASVVRWVLRSRAA